MSGRRGSKLYSIGESIEGANVSIEDIKVSEVLLNRNGAIESLPLKKSQGGGDSIISYATGRSGQISQLRTAATASASNLSRASQKPRSANGQRRKIKKPNFSGLDRALQKMGEI